MQIRYLLISPELLAQFLKEPAPPGITADGLPEDAQIVGASWADDGMIRLGIKSATFASLLPGEAVPCLEVRFRRDYQQRRYCGEVLWEWWRLRCVADGYGSWRLQWRQAHVQPAIYRTVL